MKKLASRMGGELIITTLEKDMKVFSRMTKFMDMEDIGFWEDTNMREIGGMAESTAAGKLSSPMGIDIWVSSKMITLMGKVIYIVSLKGEYFYQNGDTFKGNFKEGKREGKGEFW